MRCQIEGISHKGEGVGRIDGKAAFVPYTIPGETVEIEIIEENKKMIRAELLNIIEPSADRREPDCPHYYQCGGCAYQHLTYARQLELKRQVVQDSLQRIGKIKCEVKPVLGMEDPWRYRNKVEWHVESQTGQVRMGYYKNDSHKLIDIHTCKLISQAMEDLSFRLKEQVESVRDGKQGSLTIRQSSCDHSLLAILNELETAELNQLKAIPGLESLYSQADRKIKLCFNDSDFQEQIGKIRYQLSPLSFFQVNPAQTYVLYELVKEYCRLQPDEQLLDAFCGVGSISLYLAPYAQKVVGVESYAPAIANAKKNADLNHSENCEFITGPCEKVIPGLKQAFDVVVVDPPRAGCKPELIKALIEKSPRSIVYVSCNPATLARDLALFAKDGYAVDCVQPVDMFPQSYHCEVCCLLSKQ